MENVRRVILALLALLAGSALLTRGPIPSAACADKQLTELEIYKTEFATKDFVIDLFAAGVWTKDSDQYKQFNKYEPNAKLNIPKYNEKTEEFEKTTYPLTGAEFRRAFASAKAFGSYNKLDEEARKRLNMEFFGQEARPEKGTDVYNAGIDKAKNLLYIILGEASIAGAPAEESSKMR